MRQSLFAVSLFAVSLVAVSILFCGAAAAQPSITIGGGSGGDCGDVARQIVHDWFDVRDIMTSDGSLKRPSAGQLQCVDPANVQGMMARRAGASSLRCYTNQRVGVCCDAQLRSCAAL